MSKLHELQKTFMNDLYNGTMESAAYLANTSAGDPRRLSIYQNNLYLGLTDILKSFYPVTEKVVGDGFFKTAAKDYIPQFPQNSGNRHDFGKNFGEFLKSYAPAQTLAYLPDLAALEWAYHTTAFAADAPQITASNMHESGFYALQPSVLFVTVQHNVLDIWKAHQHDEVAPIELKQGIENYLTWRNIDNESVITTISSGGKRLLENCAAGMSFANALHDTAASTHADAKTFQQELALFMTQGVFTSHAGTN